MLLCSNHYFCPLFSKLPVRIWISNRTRLNYSFVCVSGSKFTLKRTIAHSLRNTICHCPWYTRGICEPHQVQLDKLQSLPFLMHSDHKGTSLFIWSCPAPTDFPSPRSFGLFSPEYGNTVMVFLFWICYFCIFFCRFHIVCRSY